MIGGGPINALSMQSSCLLLVGHETPEYPLGAARITLQVYTHMLPGELERARELFDKFLVNRAGDDPVPALALAR